MYFCSSFMTFQFTTSRGGRLSMNSMHLCYRMPFNSRPLEEVDIYLYGTGRLECLSIHDLTRRSTNYQWPARILSSKDCPVSLQSSHFRKWPDPLLTSPQLLKEPDYNRYPPLNPIKRGIRKRDIVRKPSAQIRDVQTLSVF